MKSALAAFRVATVWLLSAALWFALSALAGIVLVVVGVHILAGVGWATVVAGALCLVTAVLLLMGMSRGG